MRKKYKTLFAKCTRNYCCFLDLVLLFCSDYFDALGKGRVSFHGEESNRIVKMKSKGSVLKKLDSIMPLASFVCSGSPGGVWLEDGIKEVGLDRAAGMTTTEIFQKISSASRL